jgi:hypothetical protein
VGCVFPVTSSPARPSQTLQQHPQHCGNPDRWDSATPAVVRPPILRQHSPRIGARTATKQELWRYYPQSHPWTGTRLATTPAGGKLRQDDCQLHDTVRHAATCST